MLFTSCCLEENHASTDGARKQPLLAGAVIIIFGNEKRMDIDSITIDSPGWFQNSIVARKWQYSDAVNALAKHTNTRRVMIQGAEAVSSFNCKLNSLCTSSFLRLNGTVDLGTWGRRTFGEQKKKSLCYL